MIDVLSPCVTFNDHEGSTKSYAYAKDHDEVLGEVSFVPFFEDISVDYDAGTTTAVEMHDGSKLYLKKVAEDYDPTDKIDGAATPPRDGASRRVRDRRALHRARQGRLHHACSSWSTSRSPACRSSESVRARRSSTR